MAMNGLHAANWVETVSDVLLKPRPPNSSSSDAASSHPSLQTLVPLTMFDLATHAEHPAVLYAFRAPTLDNQAMIDALARTLYHFPSLAGSFTTDATGWPCVLLNDHGIRLIETRVDAVLDDHFPFDPSSELVTCLVPPLLDVRVLCQVQLNRFSCGGLALCFTAHHHVADGHAIGSFLVAWAQRTHGASEVHLPEPTQQLLLHDRTKLISLDSPPKHLFPHEGTEFISSKEAKTNHIDMVAVEASIATMVNVRIHYSKNFISRLKADVLHRSCGNPVPLRCSTFHCMLTHLWKNMTAARRLSPAVSTRVQVAVDGRRRLREPAIPASYFGNMVLWAFPTMTAGDLLAASYSEVVKVIQDAVAKIDDAYFRSFISFGEKVKRGQSQAGVGIMDLVPSAPVGGDVLCPHMEVDSWLGLDFHLLDFGGCRPCGMMPPELPIEGLSIFLPSCAGDGGVDAIVVLKKEHAKLFMELSRDGAMMGA